MIGAKAISIQGALGAPFQPGVTVLTRPQLVTASQNIPIPQNAIATYLFMVGAGGGGYLLGTAGSGAAAGACGAFVIDHRRVGVVAGSTVAISIGAGGIGSNAGGATTVSIGALTLTAQGGGPSQSNARSAPGSMSVAVGADLQFWAGRAINLLGGLYQPGTVNALLSYGTNAVDLGVTTTGICNAPSGINSANGGSHSMLLLPPWVKAAGIALGTPGNVNASNGGGAASFNGAGGNGGGTSATGYGGGGGAGSTTSGAPGCAVICFEVPA